MCLWHKWGKWKQYEVELSEAAKRYKSIGVEVRQKRVCEKCGTMQDKLVREG